MDTLLFVHGLASSGAYKLADTLRILLKPARMLSPDFPIDPDLALLQLRQLCATEQPELIVGLSWGGFLTQQLRGQNKVLINPDFHISALLEGMPEEVRYLSPRQDGALSFQLTPAIRKRYEMLEQMQFEGIDVDEQARTLGFFATGDELVHCQDIFETHYPGRAVSYPGGHLPTFPETKRFIAPPILEFCQSFITP